MNPKIYYIAIACILLMAFPGVVQCEDKPAIVNLIVNPDITVSPTREQALITESHLLNLKNEIQNRNFSATIFSTQDLAGSRVGLRLTEMGLKTNNFELAISGNNSNDILSDLSYEEQKAIFEKSKEYVESCKICGKNEIIVRGFMPQLFSQNENTYKALDDLGISYDAGFQAGVLYSPGHENDVWPYLVPGHKFYAVPVSTYVVSGKNVPLQDSYFNDSGLSASQWYDALAAKLDEISGKDEPLVVSLTTSVSGSGNYLDALIRFMDYAKSKKTSFVTTMQLVDMTKTGLRDVSALPTSNVSAECTTCGQSDSNVISLAVSTNESTRAANNTTQVAAPEVVAASK